MKFTITELKKNPNRCIEKLSNEIQSNYEYKSLSEPSKIREYSLNIASSIINDFLNDSFKSNKVLNFEMVNFGITYCEKEGFDTVWLEKRGQYNYWRAENSKEVEEAK